VEYHMFMIFIDIVNEKGFEKRRRR